MQKQLSLLTKAWQKDQATASKPGLPTKTPFDKSKVVCQACRKPGHFKVECPERSKPTTEMSAGAEASTRRVSSQKRKRRQTVNINEVTAEAVPVEMEEDAADMAEMSQSESPVMLGENSAWSGTHPVGNQEPSWWECMRRFPPPPFMLTQPTQPSMQPTRCRQQLTATYATVDATYATVNATCASSYAMIKVIIIIIIITQYL